MKLSKTTKIIIWSVSGLAVTVGAFFGIRYLIKPKTGTTDSGGVPPTNGTGTGGTGTGLHAKPTVPSGRSAPVPSVLFELYELKANKFTKIYSGANITQCVSAHFNYVPPNGNGGNGGNGDNEEPQDEPEPYPTGAPQPLASIITATNQSVGRLGIVCKAVPKDAIVGTILKTVYNLAKSTDYIKITFNVAGKYKYGYVLKKDTYINKTIVP